jgi:hypothetical protein
MKSCPSTAKKNKERGRRRTGRKGREEGGGERERKKREKPGKEGERDELFMIDLPVSCKAEFMDL